MTRRLAAITFAGCALLLFGCGEDATEDNVIDSVPADARAYAHLDRESDDWKRASEALGKLPALEGAVLDALEGAVGQVPGDGEAGVALLKGRDRPTVVGLDDPAAEHNLHALDDYQTLVAELPEQRFVHGYLGRAAAKPLRRVDKSIVSAAAGIDLDRRPRAAARARAARARGRPLHRERERRRAVGPGGPEDRDLPGGAVDRMRDPRRRRAHGWGRRRPRAVRARRTAAGRRLARGRAAAVPRHARRLVATPGERSPAITLILDDVDEAEALDLLARLQPVLIHLLQPQEFGQAPTFGSAEVAGITAATAQLAPGLELSYAAWDDRLVVSTSLQGIRETRRAEGLSGEDAFESVLGDRPSEFSALLFLDLNQLLALGEQAGLAEDPRYLAVRDDLQKLRAAGAVLSREEKFTTAELTFQIP